MQVMILAAGKSSRLGALGAVLPKPLVPICGYPAIEFGLALCREAGLGEIVINLHHHGELIRKVVGDGRRFGARIAYSEEPELLGTGGGLRQARALFRSEPVLVMNGKVVADIDLRQVIAAHREAAMRPVATMLLRDDPRKELWAPVAVDVRGRVVGLRGVRGPMTTVGEVAERMFTGIHVLEKGLLDRIPPGVSDVIGEAYMPALQDGAPLAAALLEGYFAEHSTPERYLEGNLALLRQPGLVKQPPGPLVGVDPAARVAASAKIVAPVRIAAGAVVEAGATVGPEVVVCGGGRVASGARLERAVVWEGAMAEGEARDVIVTSEGTVPGR